MEKENSILNQTAENPFASPEGIPQIESIHEIDHRERREEQVARIVLYVGIVVGAALILITS